MEVVNVQYTGPETQYQTYSQSDLTLISNQLINASFGGTQDYIELFVKSVAGNVLEAEYNYTNYKIEGVVNSVSDKSSRVFVDPERDARDLGYDRGTFNVKYNFLTKQLQSGPPLAQNFWIKQISTSRTELKAARQDLSNTALANAFTAFNSVLSSDNYYPTFYLNFGNDTLLIGVNAVYVEEGGSGYIIFKLYEPLPANIDLKATFWVVTEVAEPANYSVSIQVAADQIVETRQLRGPNFDVKINDRAGQTTNYYTYESLLSTSVTSSYQQLQSLMAEKGITINVDYSDFSNFVRFSSATERLYNFVYKVQQIESASAGLDSPNTSTAKVLLRNQIDSITKNFDGWEYSLYYNSGSTSWPKASTTSPYPLYSVTSSQAINWLGGVQTNPAPGIMSMFWSASYYDNQNKDALLRATPGYLLEDDQNVPYLTFLNMIGQHFDNIWIYLKDVTSRYDANNNPFVGISMDQVSEALQSFGIQLYANTSVSDNIYYSMFGINQTGSSLPVTASAYSRIVYDSSSIYPLQNQPYLTASLYLPPFGEEKIERYVLTYPSASSTVTASFQTLPDSQLNDEIYKRLYHNLAYLLKTRGTERGVKALIATYGIPEDILNVKEFGGYLIGQVAGVQSINPQSVITGSVLQLSSSLLSPNATIQYYSNNRERTSANLEIAFSPADSINASITSSTYITAGNPPGYFDIMQYIGAPNLQYSSSYIPLDVLRDGFFNAEYTSRYNVWDFIRVIKYYNNSVFKMLRDWVPARSNPVTGILIKPHLLERSKYPRKEPTVSTSSYEADYDLLTVTGSDGGSVQGSTAYVEGIPVGYSINSAALATSVGTVFVSSSDDSQRYTGEFSGSYIDVTDGNFTQEEVSSYIAPWTSSVAPSQHGGTNILFITYSTAPVFQNVTGSVISQRFLDLDYNGSQLAPVNFNLITQSLEQSAVIGPVSQSIQPYSQYAQYQDYNQSARPYTIPRYSGSYLSGKSFNTHSAGDVSYGDDPVINYNTKRLGLFTQIATSSFLPGKVNASLAYLADVSGGLFELNQNNKNWTDIQNTFKAGTTLTIKQFDNKKYSNQVTTDGIKTIYNSGYSYTPQLYFLSTSNEVYFEYTGDTIATSFIGYNSGTPDAFISGGGTPYYAVTITDAAKRAGNVFRLFDAESPASSDFGVGDAVSWASYTASQAGQSTFTVDFDLNIEFPDPEFSGIQSGSYSWGAYLNNTTLIGTLQRVQFTSSYTPAGTSTGRVILNGNADQTQGTLSPEGSPTVYSGPFTLYDNDFPNPSAPIIGTGASTITAQTYTWTRDVGGFTQIDQIILINGTSFDLAGTFQEATSPYPDIVTNIVPGGLPVPAVKVRTAQLPISYTTPAISLGPDSKVVFQFKQEGVSTSNYTASVSTGLANSTLARGTIAVGQGGYPYASTNVGGTIEPFIDTIEDSGTQASIITLSEGISQYLGYQMVPYFESASVVYQNALYTAYGDVNVTFNPQFGDKIIAIDFGGISQDFDVLSTETVGGQLKITVVPQALDNWVANPKLVYRFLVLRRYNDEQNVILTFNKAPGQTSYGFLIPETISEEVTDNINTLQAAVQSQILT